jgi:ACS family hexuronate transporter-like MFS transporter
MNDISAPSEQKAEASTVGQRIGRVIGRICALLFVATSISYMDREVIGLLKPTPQQSIGLTELDYG